MASSAFGWAWLPRELFDLILDRLVEFTDYVRFCSVCKPWRLIALGEDESDSGYHRLHRQRLCILKSCRNKLPMMVIPTKHNADDLRSFYSIVDGKLYDIPLPLPCETRFFGSSHGWLFTKEKSLAITLINPLSGKTILLPEFKDPWGKYQPWLDKNYDKFPGKAILSSDPCLNPSSYEIVVIYLGSMDLAVFRSGDNAWKFLTLRRQYFFCDVLYYKGLLHAVNHFGEMVCIEDGTDKVVVEPAIPPPDFTTIHLVESHQGDLLMVWRFLNDNQDNTKCKTVDFKVFKLLRSYDQARPMWVQIESIGDQALFLGDNHAVCVLTSEFPRCKPNSIYYTEHYFDELGYAPCGTDDDNGVFNLAKYVPDPSHKPLLPPIWIVPSFITG
ncbi:hypothetical protein RJ639_030103 [Escallonia herrerae]|uniref:KIB1-4 beta-propeller domain-containing protein n=1 Tax=Escallonia herrerae TaxID=1293975 RepID=A0AA88X803_9ASTE|nr:hypothetical protein RJ639_030103 [Escallonia herrerae]